jgi:acyl carrier protein
MDTAEQIHCYLEGRFSPSGRDLRLTGDTLLLEEKILDSIGMLELLLFIEETFDIEVPEEDIAPDNFNTIGNLAAYVDRKRLQSV